MNSPLLKLFTHPADAWLEIRRAEEDHPQQYLPRLLMLALIPAVCLFVGTTTFGWSLAAEERVRLSMGSAAQLAGLLYASTVIGVMLMGVIIRGMSRGFDAQPSLNQCIGFAAYCATPWFFAGVVGLVPIRWVAFSALLAASAYASVLLYGGLQTFLRLKKEQAMLFATCVWGVGLLVMVTILVAMILFWFNGLMPEYVRPASLG
ncbi:Yip1 family protein [Pseudomonas sp. DCB_BI]|uniref:Yip1 family protein n=1 Tax=Pseudomonas sp. DCB_BI TaxID=2993594 RepID=UPI00224B54E8|nr:Yip1 family protein [Pseudomonas sp. DCB_BI]MCX2888041.1 Yip1 family protein [Pseudomonas sp. DCB_BI]